MSDYEILSLVFQLLILIVSIVTVSVTVIVSIITTKKRLLPSPKVSSPF